MPLFEYVVRDKEGKNITSKREADQMDELVGWLRDQNFMIIRVNEVKTKGQVFSAGKGNSKKARKIKIDELVIFSRQLATMVEAGVPLVQALNILGEQVENLNMQRVVNKIHDDVEGGRSLSEALSMHRKVFSPLFISMTHAGEESGRLEEILDRLASYIEKITALQKKIKSALIYPAVVAALATIITVGMMTWVIPQFAGIFEQLNAPLPTPTVMLIKASLFLKENLIAVVVGLGFSIFMFAQFIKTKPGRWWFDGVKLKMLVFGPLFLKVAVSKFSRTLSTLIKSGVAILKALEIVAATSGNVRIEAVVNEIRESIREGESISGPLAKKKIFPPMVIRMIAVGEETGELDKMLTKVADFYDVQVDAGVEGLTSLIEPLVIAFLGIVIGAIVIAMFLPILTLTSAL